MVGGRLSSSWRVGSSRVAPGAPGGPGSRVADHRGDPYRLERTAMDFASPLHHQEAVPRAPVEHGRPSFVGIFALKAGSEPRAHHHVWRSVPARARRSFPLDLRFMVLIPEEEWLAPPDSLRPREWGRSPLFRIPPGV